MLRVPRPGRKHRKADLRLDAEKEAKAGGVIVPGKPGESALVARITPAAWTAVCRALVNLGEVITHE